jgi:TrmH family RNA methyltransferase
MRMAVTVDHPVLQKDSGGVGLRHDISCPYEGMMENLRVVLVGARNPLNIGAVARAMSNFGAMHLRVVAPYEKAWREAKSAVGAAELMARAEEFATVGEAIADCTLVVGTTAVGNREIRQRLVSLVDAGPELREKVSATRVALLFGSEKWGLSNESLSHCHWLVRIPTREEHRSMNLGQAVAVCLYELGRGKKIENGKSKVGKVITTEGTEGPQRKRRGREIASMENVERITRTLLEALHVSGYIAPKAKRLAEEKLRRMILRFRLEAGDAEVFLGMVSKILWKLEQK